MNGRLDGVRNGKQFGSKKKRDSLSVLGEGGHTDLTVRRGGNLGNMDSWKKSGGGEIPVDLGLSAD